MFSNTSLSTAGPDNRRKEDSFMTCCWTELHSEKSIIERTQEMTKSRGDVAGFTEFQDAVYRQTPYDGRVGDVD